MLGEWWRDLDPFSTQTLRAFRQARSLDKRKVHRHQDATRGAHTDARRDLSGCFRPAPTTFLVMWCSLAQHCSPILRFLQGVARVFLARTLCFVISCSHVRRALPAGSCLAAKWLGISPLVSCVMVRASSLPSLTTRPIIVQPSLFATCEGGKHRARLCPVFCGDLPRARFVAFASVGCAWAALHRRL